MQYEAGSYDVIVIGAGHAGSEAGLAAARVGAKTLMITINLGYGRLYAMQSLRRRAGKRDSR